MIRRKFCNKFILLSLYLLKIANENLIKVFILHSYVAYKVAKWDRSSNICAITTLQSRMSSVLCSVQYFIDKKYEGLKRMLGIGDSQKDGRGRFTSNLPKRVRFNKTHITIRNIITKADISDLGICARTRSVLYL